MTPTGTSADVFARLDELHGRLKPGGRPSFHAFEYRGTRLVYDILSGSLFTTSDAAFRVLRGVERDLDPERMRAALADVDEEELAGVVEDLHGLHGVGMLRAEPDSTRRQQREVANGLMAHHPRKMMLMVQSNCNLACSYCYEVINGFHSTGNRMDFETARRSVEFLIERSGRRADLEITFFGGEPLMNFKLIREVVDYCRGRESESGKRFYYQVTTNCVLLDDEVIEYLVANEFSVMVSLDGPPELHDIHRKDVRGQGTGEQAIANAKRLVAAQKAAGVREAMVRVTMTHQSHDSRRISAYFASEGFRRVMVGATDGRFDRKDEWDLDGADIDELHEAGEEAVEQYLRWIDGEGPAPEDVSQVVRSLDPILEALRTPNPAPKIRCGVARNMQAITRDGKIYPCHRYAGEDAFQLGTLEQGLDPAKVQAYYDKLLAVKEEHCSRCWARITCGGQCPWYISNESGAIGHPDEESCNGIRRGHERFLWFVHELTRRGRLDDLRAQVEREKAASCANLETEAEGTQS